MCIGFLRRLRNLDVRLFAAPREAARSGVSEAVLTDELLVLKLLLPFVPFAQDPLD